MAVNNANGEKVSGSDRVLAVVAPTSADGAIADLKRQGFDNAERLTGWQAANELDSRGEHSGLLTKLMKLVNDHLSEEPNYLAQYEAEAREGNDILAVPVSSQEGIQAVRETIERHGGKNIRHFSTLAVTDLTPESNPSLRSDASPEPDAAHAKELGAN